MDLVKRHQENQEKIGNSWRTALKTARETKRKKGMEKKVEIKEHINKLRVKERKIMEQLFEAEKEKSEEVLKLATDAQHKTNGATDDHKTDDMKNQHINAIWTDTLAELGVVLERQRERLKRLDDSIKSFRQAPTSAQNVNALKDQRNSIYDMKTNNVNELHTKLDQILKDMDKVCHHIEDNDRKEREELEKILSKSRIKETEEKEKLWKAFMDDMKRQQR